MVRRLLSLLVKDLTPFRSDMYQRNNKRTGLKNIRCFPYCSTNQHMEHGFCGQPVVLRVSRHSQQQPLSELFAWGEFKRADLGTLDQDEDDPPPALIIELGTRVSASLLAFHTKDPKSAKMETLDKPLFEGMITDSSKQMIRRSTELKFVFNQRKKGWNYNWQANKHTVKSKHSFFVYLFEKCASSHGGEDEFVCVSVNPSPSFVLYCRKKKFSVHSELIPTPPAFTASTSSLRLPMEKGNNNKRVKMTPALPSTTTTTTTTTLTTTTTTTTAMIRPLSPNTLNSLFKGEFLHTPRNHVISSPSVGEEEDDNNEVLDDFESLQEVDSQVLRRIERVLQTLYTQLTQDNSSQVLDVNQFALDWFLKDLDSIKSDLLFDSELQLFPPSVVSQQQTTADDGGLMAELANYLLEESSVTASIHRIMLHENPLERRLGLVHMFNLELSTFLLSRGLSEKDLDAVLLLDGGATAATNTSHLSLLEEQVDSLRTCVKFPVSKTAFCWPKPVLSPQEDLTGTWRLDDSLRGALDDCRKQRGIPYPMRKLLGFMEAQIQVSHFMDKIVVNMRSKLFATPQLDVELDGQEHVLQRALPIPWAAQVSEVYCAWMEGSKLHHCRTYGVNHRTELVVNKNASGDRLDVDVKFWGNHFGGEWGLVLMRRGYALRVVSSSLY